MGYKKRAGKSWALSGHFQEEIQTAEKKRRRESALRGHFQEEVQTAEKKNAVGRPGAQKRGKLADGAQSFEESRGSPIDDGQPNPERQSPDGATASHQN